MLLPKIIVKNISHLIDGIFAMCLINRLKLIDFCAKLYIWPHNIYFSIRFIHNSYYAHKSQMYDGYKTKKKC